VRLAKLQWEPLFDIMSHLLPNLFIEHRANPHRYLKGIQVLAAGIGEPDALVLFPEGHDFTPSLRQRMLRDEAERAERMAGLLPPKHGGVMAAVAGAPSAEAVFVAHTVLEDLGTFADLLAADSTQAANPVPLLAPGPERGAPRSKGSSHPSLRLVAHDRSLD
jgi:hypothetical protein